MGDILIWRKEGADPALTEMVWEQRMHTFGAELFDLRNEDKDASETATGKGIIRKYLGAAETAIAAMQATPAPDRDRTERTTKGTALMVPADSLALLTLKVIIDKTFAVPEPETGASASVVARVIAEAVANELNFRNWITTTDGEAAEYAKAHGISKPQGRAERLIAEQGTSAKTVSRWKKAFAELSKFKWNDLSEIYCGANLLQCVVEALPDCFEIHHPNRKGKTPRSVRMLPAFYDSFQDRESRVALIQPLRKPMLTQPHDWSLS